MRNIFRVFIAMLLMMGTFTLCSCHKMSGEETIDKGEELAVEIQDGFAYMGKKEDVEAGMRTIQKNSRIDPADDYVISARRSFREGDYSTAEKECLEALRTAKHKIVFSSAHRTLLNIYEITKRYELAIKEIDWLLENVSVYAKPELIEKRKKLQKIIEGSEK